MGQQPGIAPTCGYESESLPVARNLVARVMIGVDRGHARRNRGAPTPRSVPHGRTPAPTFPWRTAASPGPPALARAPRAGRPSRLTASALAQRLARLARPAPRRDWGPPLGPGPALPGQGRTRTPARS